MHYINEFSLVKNINKRMIMNKKKVIAVKKSSEHEIDERHLTRKQIKIK